MKKILISVFTLFVVLIVFTATFDYFKARPIKEYCDSLKLGTSVNEALKIAIETNLKTPNNDENSEYIVVSNHFAPYFRWSCVMNFENKKLINKTATPTD